MFSVLSLELRTNDFSQCAVTQFYYKKINRSVRMVMQRSAAVGVGLALVVLARATILDTLKYEGRLSEGYALLVCLCLLAARVFPPYIIKNSQLKTAAYHIAEM
jgi:hypothetical protein